MKLPISVAILLFAVTNAALAGDTNVGIAKVDITPEMGISMAGTISQNTPVKEIHDPLFVRAIAINDGTRTLAIAIVDNTMISDKIHDKAKELIEKNTSIPPSHVIIAATHSHSTPRAVVGLVKAQNYIDYLDSLSVKIAEAVTEAYKSVVPAKLGWDSFDAPEHVHNRRWFVEEASQFPAPFGGNKEVVRMNPGFKNLAKPAGPVDPEFFLFSVQRKEDSSPLALLANYGLHYVGGTEAGVVSADYFGAFSETIGKKLDADDAFLGILSNGTSGDVNNIDFSKPRIKKAAYVKINEVAEDLATRSVPTIKKIIYHSDIKLDAIESTLTLKVRKPDAIRMKWIKENLAPSNTKIRLTRPQVYAKEGLALSKYPDEVDVRIIVFRLGDLAIVALPNEVFAETGLAIKKESPFPGNTFTIELANGYHGYLPSAEQHRWGGYETWPARSAYLETSAEGKIRKRALKLLAELRSK